MARKTKEIQKEVIQEKVFTFGEKLMNLHTEPDVANIKKVFADIADFMLTDARNPERQKALEADPDIKLIYNLMANDIMVKLREVQESCINLITFKIK